MSWAERAQRFIASIELTMPSGTTLKVMRRALRSHAHEFHGGTSWGKKIWSRESRRHLEKHYGLPPRTPLPLDPLFAKLNAPDIIFPFRNKEEGNVDG